MKKHRMHSNETPTHAAGGKRASARQAFTMIEMIVVVGLILLLSAVAVPSFVQLFSSGASAQAYNMVSAQLMAARNVAVERGQYAGLHFQRPDATKGPFRRIRGDFEYFAYCGVVVGTYNTATKNVMLDMNPGFDPKPMPGHMTLADIDQATKTDGYNFTTGTIMFNPNGSLVTRTDITTSLNTLSQFVDTQNTAIWINLAASRVYRPCSNAVLFSLDDYKLVAPSLSDTTTLNDFLNTKSERVLLNYNTGLLLQRK